jgi:hypothetical protein
MPHLFISFLLLVIFSFSSLGQSTIKNIQVDNLGYVYIIQKDKIFKLDNESKLKYSFSYKNSGDISSIDVSDPLKIVVFYENFSQIIFLDNTLSISNGPVSLFKMNVVNPTLVCSTSDKGLWIYDKQGFTLFKYDANFQLLFSVSDLPTILGSAFEPVYMMNNNSYLYLSDSINGIFIFDQYGALYKKLHFKGISIFDIDNNSIVYSENDFIKKIDLINYDEYIMNLLSKNNLGVTVKNNVAYLINNEGDSFSKQVISFIKK